MLRSGQFWIFLQQLCCIFSCILKELRILKDISDLKIQDSALPDAEQISRPSEPQVFSRDKESVVGTVQNVQSFFCLFGF